MTTSSGVDAGEVELAVGAAASRKRDPHVAQLLVDVRIVDDLADQEEPPVGKLGAGLVGVLDRAVDAVAEPELPGQPEGQRPDVEPV